MVNIKLIPADTGITNVKFAEDNALNITKRRNKNQCKCTYYLYIHQKI